MTDTEDLGLRSVEPEPPLFGEYPTIQAALRDGGKLHAFRSGGGLRVVSVENKKWERLGYGEAVYIETAMNYCEEDCVDGVRAYADVYGKIHPHYMTGSQTPSCPLDRWLLVGNGFYITFNGGQFRFESKYNRDRKVPRSVIGAVQTTGISVRYRMMGLEYEASFDNRFGRGGVSVSCISHASGADEWFCSETFRVQAESMAALLAKLTIEIPREFNRVDQFEILK